VARDSKGDAERLTWVMSMSWLAKLMGFEGVDEEDEGVQVV